MTLFTLEIMMTAPSYRIACAGDIPAMSAIRLAVQENRLSDPTRITAQMYADYLDLLGRGWVCERDGAITGFAYADRAGGSIWALFVDPAHEGAGIVVARHVFAREPGHGGFGPVGDQFDRIDEVLLLAAQLAEAILLRQILDCDVFACGFAL